MRVSTVFPRWMNALPAAIAVGAGVAAAAAIGGIWHYFTPEYWEVGYMPDQPVKFSHQIHAGQLGIDCRYCHTHVEESAHSNVPSTSTCINCHQGDTAADLAYLNSDLWAAHKINEDLIQVRTADDTEEPIRWRRIHKVPDYAHFNHAVHVNAGVSCYSCHGRIDQMEVVYQVESLSMAWCLDCHREPQKHLVDVDGLLTETMEQGGPVEVTDLARVAKLLARENQSKEGLLLAESKQLQPPEHCAACHY